MKKLRKPRKYCNENVEFYGIEVQPTEPVSNQNSYNNNQYAGGGSSSSGYRSGNNNQPKLDTSFSDVLKNALNKLLGEK